MANFQKTLDSLQPYVIQIRYVDGTPIVDAVFKEGWNVPDDKDVKKVAGDGSMNYFMLYTETDGGIDLLFAYVERVIKLNQEREKKLELLRKKVNELKDIFSKNSLKKLLTLKFTFSGDDLVPKLEEFEVEDLISETPIEEDIIEETIVPIQPPVTKIPAKAPVKAQVAPVETVEYVDENNQPIPLTEEDREMMEEEARAERNRQIYAKPNAKPKVSSIATKVELPPKRKIQTAITAQTDCDCGPNEACDKCIDSKDF